MLLQGLVEIKDFNITTQSTGRKLRSCVLTTKIQDYYCLRIKNSMYPNCITYKIINISKLHTRFSHQGKLGIHFIIPNHVVLFHADDIKMLILLVQQIRDMISGKNVFISERTMPKNVPPKKDNVNIYNPMNYEFTANRYFDNRILNMQFLKKLVMENGHLPKLPEQLGNLPIEYLSLSGSLLASTQYNKDTLWDWMSGNTIVNTLTTLKMSSNGLKILPFEILYLRNLQTLCVDHNQLSYLPMYIEELTKLKNLSVSHNCLTYLPDYFHSKTFNQLDISNNLFIEIDIRLDHINNYYLKSDNIIDKPRHVVKKLMHLALCSLVENNVQIKRQHIPRTLWYYFNFISRCSKCRKFILPDYACLLQGYDMPRLRASNFTTNNFVVNIPWLMLQCNKCNLM